MIMNLQTNRSTHLSASVVPLEGGFHFMFTTRDARRRSREEFVTFQHQFSAGELRRLRDLIDAQLCGAASEVPLIPTTRRD